MRTKLGFRRPLEDYPPSMNEQGNYFEIKGYKMGSIEYQNALLESILYKTKKNIELNPIEEVFIDIQGEFNHYPFREILKRIKFVSQKAEVKR